MTHSIWKTSLKAIVTLAKRDGFLTKLKNPNQNQNPTNQLKRARTQFQT